MQEEINSVDKAIQEANTSLIEYNNSIRDIQWDVFDKLQDKISGITDESDFLIKLMSNDKLFDDKGNITDKGKATMGLHGVNYNTYMSQADQYRKEMDAIQKEIDADPDNQTLIDRRKELLELQREAIQNAEDEKDAIKDLVEDGIKKQLDSLQDLIDKFNETKRTQQDLYEYEKEVAEQQDKISSIKKRLEAYKNDTSEEGMMNRQELEVELGKAETDLEETQRDKSIQETEKLLNNLLDEYEQVLTMRLDNIDQLISDVIANVNSEAGGIGDTIITEAEDVGYKLTDSMNTIWGANGTIATILTSYSNNFSSTMTTVQQAINDIKNYIKDAVSKSDSAANPNTGDSGNNSSSTPPPQPAPQPTPPKSTSPQGDGTPNKGDKVTFVSGNYYYDSYGKRPLGHRYQGQEVYITKINPKGSKPYHISTGNKLGDGDLGWVTLEQLRGYKNGTNAVESDTNIVGLSMPEVGETMTVKINGVESAETVKAYSNNSGSYKYIGNIDVDSLLNGGTGWVIIMLYDDKAVGFANPDTTISIEVAIIHKINEKFINFDGFVRTFNYYFKDHRLYKILYKDNGSECLLYMCNNFISPEADSILFGFMGEIGFSAVGSFSKHSCFVTGYEINNIGNININQVVLGTDTAEMEKLAAGYGYTHNTNPNA